MRITITRLRGSILLEALFSIMILGLTIIGVINLLGRSMYFIENAHNLEKAAEYEESLFSLAEILIPKVNYPTALTADSMSDFDTQNTYQTFCEDITPATRKSANSRQKIYSDFLFALVDPTQSTNIMPGATINSVVSAPNNDGILRLIICWEDHNKYGVFARSKQRYYSAKKINAWDTIEFPGN